MSGREVKNPRVCGVGSSGFGGRGLCLTPQKTREVSQTGKPHNGSFKDSRRGSKRVSSRVCLLRVSLFGL